MAERASWMPPLDAGPVAFFGHFKAHRGWATGVFAVCLLGIAYGFYYYASQFEVTPLPYWVFVPDSPLAVLWAALAILAHWLGRKSALLDSLAYIGNAQVGLWTVYVLVAYADHFGTYRLNLNTILLAGHAGMALLALVFLQGLRERRAAAPGSAALAMGAAAAYYFANDVLDYYGPDFSRASFPSHGCGLRPWTVPCDAAAEVALLGVTFALTALAVATLLLLSRPRTGTKLGR